jgi:hypothetical protein
VQLDFELSDSTAEFLLTGVSSVPGLGLLFNSVLGRDLPVSFFFKLQNLHLDLVSFLNMLSLSLFNRSFFNSLERNSFDNSLNHDLNTTHLQSGFLLSLFINLQTTFVSSLVLFSQVILDSVNSPSKCLLVLSNIVSELFDLHNELFRSLFNSLGLSNLQFSDFFDHIFVDSGNFDLYFLPDLNNSLRNSSSDLGFSELELLDSLFNLLQVLFSVSLDDLVEFKVGFLDVLGLFLGFQSFLDVGFKLCSGPGFLSGQSLPVSCLSFLKSFLSSFDLQVSLGSNLLDSFSHNASSSSDLFHFDHIENLADHLSSLLDLS